MHDPAPVSVESLPLFPLQTVLVPGAALGLRIFERRYLDLVRDCGRDGHGFGVCLVLGRSESGDDDAPPPAPAAFGTEAEANEPLISNDDLLKSN